MASQTFGERVRHIRESRKRTLEQAADRAEGSISKTGLLRIENDQREPLLTSLEAIAIGVGLEIRINPKGVFIEAWEEDSV